MTYSSQTGRSAVLWAGALVATSLVFTLGFACITPLAGLAVVAAFTLPRGAALATMLAVWAANQAAGFLILDYPQTANAYEWGAAIGLATLATLALATLIARRVSHRALGPVLALIGGCAVFEAALYAASLLALGDAWAYTPEIVARVCAINAAACALMLVVQSLGLPRLGLALPGRAALTR